MLETHSFPPIVPILASDDHVPLCVLCHASHVAPTRVSSRYAHVPCPLNSTMSKESTPYARSPGLTRHDGIFAQ